MGGVVAFSVPAGRMMVRGALTMVLLILSTYTLCVHQDECPVFLPTISHTWEHPPGSYISRWTVGVVTDLMAVMMFVVYWADAAAKRAPTKWDGLADTALLATSVAAIFCLSWVGAICDSDDPDCRGNNTIHTIFATTFFVLFDLFMVSLHLHPRGAPTAMAARRPRAHVLELALAALSCALTVVQVRFDLGDTLLACVEWTNVGVIVAWLVSNSTRLGTFAVGLVRTDTADGAWTVRSALSSRDLLRSTIGLSVGTLASSLVAAVVFGNLPSDKTIPYISDLWVYPPGNWLSRWGVVHGAHCLALLHVMLASARVGVSARLPAALALVLPLVAALGLSVVGCVNEDENLSIHLTAAGVWFGLYDVYMVLVVLGSSDGYARRAAPSALAAIACQVARFALPHAAAALVGAAANVKDLEALLEWTNFGLMLTFLSTLVRSALDAPDSALEKLHFAVLEAKSRASTGEGPACLLEAPLLAQPVGTSVLLAEVRPQRAHV